MVQRIEKIASQLQEIAKNILPSSDLPDQPKMQAKAQRFSQKLTKLSDCIGGRMCDLEKKVKEKEKQIKKLKKTIRKSETQIQRLETEVLQKRKSSRVYFEDEQIVVKRERKFSKYEQKYNSDQGELAKLCEKIKDLERKNLKLLQENNSFKAQIDSQKIFISALMKEKGLMIQNSDYEYSDEEVMKNQNQTDDQNETFEIYESEDEEERGFEPFLKTIDHEEKEQIPTVVDENLPKVQGNFMTNWFASFTNFFR